LSSFRLGRAATIKTTLVAVILTLANIWVPLDTAVPIPTIANRGIAILALVVTGVLSDLNRQYQQVLSQQQAKLQAQEKLANVREDFAATLTHDLKTPLWGAIETLKALRQGAFGAIHPPQRQVLDTMIRSHQTSLQMVGLLVDVYRNDTQGLQLNLTAVELGAIAEEVTSTLAELAANRRISISTNYGASDFRRVLWVNGDLLQLQRVFTNLITNAINHSPRGGKIEVRLESQPNYQVVKVMDSGSGIPPEAFIHLFERFYQGDSDRQAKGTGLGLYLSRQIIEAHGGTIWAENRSPQGAIFGFRLPALPVPPALVN
jgi:two-component system NarL family sensor kinase